MVIILLWTSGTGSLLDEGDKEYICLGFQRLKGSRVQATELGNGRHSLRKALMIFLESRPLDMILVRLYTWKGLK